MAKLLVVDDETSIREFLEILFLRAGHQVRLAKDAVDAIAVLKAHPIDLVLTDLRLPRGSGMDVLTFVTKEMPSTQVVIMTAFATTETAIEAMKAGAYDYIIKPFKVDELTVLLDRALERRRLQTENVALKATLSARAAHSRLLGSSERMQEVFELIQKVAPTRTTILLTGESGTGKELVARAIHTRGPRVNEPFVAINCGAIPETLIESELFGHTKGSFTGATADKPGLFERAENGTVFLDEIGELPLKLQGKLLRVLQDREFERVGGTKTVVADIRVVCATHRDLEAMVDDGTFREDLYYRIKVVPLHTPALRERGHTDLLRLIEHFVSTFSRRHRRPSVQISDAAIGRLRAHPFPGNIRELEHVIESAVVMCDGDVIEVRDLGIAERRRGHSSSPTAIGATSTALLAVGGQLGDPNLTLQQVENEHVRLVLDAVKGNQSEAARKLGIGRNTLARKLSGEPDER